VPFPKAGDKYWQKQVPVAMRNDYIQLGNLYQKKKLENMADLILKQLENSDEVVLLDEKGKQYSSMGFSEFLSKKMLASHKRMIFVVGGPYGFSERVYQRANGKISLSSMTFSHQMIRVIFVEQVYRAMTILKGEPYHHE
jgi:23S rRNA (pseudouridine1915-N3)-methyltransferase